MTATTTISPLKPSFGARVEGVDVRRMPVEELHALFREHRLLVFPGQQLDHADQHAVTTTLGPEHVSRMALPGKQYQSFISNRRDARIDGDGEILLHSDAAFADHPIFAISLYGISIPSDGGDTVFADCAAVHAQLPEALRRRIAPLHALHVLDHHHVRADRPFWADGIPGDFPKAVHPLVLAEPNTGAPMVYVNRLMTARVVELPDAESSALLDELLTYFEEPAVRYQHQWSPGDLVLWDNRSLVHARTPFDPDQERTLRRVAVEGPRA